MALAGIATLEAANHWIRQSYLPAYNAAGDKFAMTGRPTVNALGATLQVVATGSNKADIVYEDKTRNVMALMPHPERACEALLGGVDGRVIFDSILRAVAGNQTPVHAMASQV